MRVFYVAYVTDYGLRRSIDAIRLLADPSVNWPAHITVRGPYDKPQDYSLFSDMLRGSVIAINGYGTFYTAKQNTVYLRCKSPSLSDAWHKPGLGFTPHITLYDGPSREFSRELLSMIDGRPLIADFISDGLHELISGVGSRELCPSCILSSGWAESVIGDRLSGETLRTLDDSSRLIYIGRIWDYLTKNRKGLPAPDPGTNCCASRA